MISSSQFMATGSGTQKKKPLKCSSGTNSAQNSNASSSTNKSNNSVVLCCCFSIIFAVFCFFYLWPTLTKGLQSRRGDHKILEITSAGGDFINLLYLIFFHIALVGHLSIQSFSYSSQLISTYHIINDLKTHFKSQKPTLSLTKAVSIISAPFSQNGRSTTTLL